MRRKLLWVCLACVDTVHQSLSGARPVGWPPPSTCLHLHSISGSSEAPSPLPPGSPCGSRLPRGIEQGRWNTTSHPCGPTTMSTLTSTLHCFSPQQGSVRK